MLGGALPGEAMGIRAVILEHDVVQIDRQPDNGKRNRLIRGLFNDALGILSHRGRLASARALGMEMNPVEAAQGSSL